MHGDMIWDTYNDMKMIRPLATQLFMFSYMFVSIYVIVNILTIIIEEGFMKAK